MGFTNGSVDKESTYKAGDTGDAGSIPGSRSSPGGENGDPLQYSCLKNPMVRGAWWATVQRVTKNQTQLNDKYTCICLNESLCYTPETSTTFLINYHPI